MVAACAAASGIFAGLGKFGVVALAPMFVAMLLQLPWKEKLGRKMGVQVDDSGPGWFSWALVAAAVLFVVVLLFFGTETTRLFSGILCGSILPFAFVVSTRQISQQAAKRLSSASSVAKNGTRSSQDCSGVSQSLD